jgi:hypothetical protein
MSIVQAYLEEGMALVAIPLGKKGPVSAAWNKLENVITDPAAAASLTENVGLAHAYNPSGPTMAVDIDDMARAEQWLAARGINVHALLEAEDAVQIISGKAGRAKLLYRLPSGLAPIESLTVKDKELIDGWEKQITVLEFRCGTRDGLTVQDVLPPSSHPETGLPYRWGGKGNWRDIPEIPQTPLTVWQQELAARETGRTRRKGRLSLFGGVDDTPRQRATLQDQLQHISADCSYELYRDIVWAILSFGWPDAEDLARQWCETAPERFEEDDFYNVVNSHDSTRSPTIGTIYYHARQGGWHG